MASTSSDKEPSVTNPLGVLKEQDAPEGFIEVSIDSATKRTAGIDVFGPSREEAKMKVTGEEGRYVVRPPSCLAWDGEPGMLDSDSWGSSPP